MRILLLVLPIWLFACQITRMICSLPATIMWPLPRKHSYPTRQFTDGHTRRQSLHVCCHFDPKKRIDYYSLYFPAGSPADQTVSVIQ